MLRAGADDLGGTLMEGASCGHRASGPPARPRTTTYRLVVPSASAETKTKTKTT
jgi:hypothetical protein